MPGAGRLYTFAGTLSRTGTFDGQGRPEFKLTSIYRGAYYVEGKEPGSSEVDLSATGVKSDSAVYLAWYDDASRPRVDGRDSLTEEQSAALLYEAYKAGAVEATSSKSMGFGGAAPLTQKYDPSARVGSASNPYSAPASRGSRL